MNQAKFSVFADLHYRDGDWNWASQRLEDIFRRAEAENVDFIMHCGDFCHNVLTGKPIIDRYNSFSIPTRHTVGNHDFEQTDGLMCVLDAYQMEKNYYFFDCNGIRMISVDTNYHRGSNGELLHYADDTAWAKCHQEAVILPPEELKFLCSAVAEAPGPCVIFSHESAIRPGDLANGPEVRRALAAVRENRPVLWINGHHHRNHLQLMDGVAWFDLNSTTSDWVNNAHHAYPEELMKRCQVAEHELLYDTPVHAVVTVTGDGLIDIAGMTGEPYLGITPEMVGNPSVDRGGFPFDTSVLSARFRLLS